MEDEMSRYHERIELLRMQRETGREYHPRSSVEIAIEALDAATHETIHEAIDLTLVALRATREDDEANHEIHDMLLEAVVEAIATGMVEDPVDLCRHALASNSSDCRADNRWYA
jgi:hypothetical protein